MSPRDQELRSLYEHVVFSVRDPEGKLIRFTAQTAGQYPFLRQKQFAIITAFNPMNEPTEERLNQKNNVLLEEDLKQNGYLFYKTEGKLGEHAEESFTIENISKPEAVRFGVKYRQHSILYNDRHGVQFPRCYSA